MILSKFFAPNIDKLIVKNDTNGLIKVIQYKRSTLSELSVRVIIDYLSTIDGQHTIALLSSIVDNETESNYIREYAARSLMTKWDVLDLNTQINCAWFNDSIYKLHKLEEIASSKLSSLIHSRQYIRTDEIEDIISLNNSSTNKTLLIIYEKLNFDPRYQYYDKQISMVLSYLSNSEHTPDPVDYFIHKLSPSPTLKTIYALGELGDNRAVIPLIDGLSKEISDSACCEIIKSLKLLGNQQAVKPILDLLVSLDPQEFYRRQGIREIIMCCISTLGHLRAKSAVPALLKFLEQSDESIPMANTYKRASVLALGTIGDKSATKPILSILRSHEGSIGVVSALAQIGDPTSIEDVIKWLVKNTGPGTDINNRKLEDSNCYNSCFTPNTLDKLLGKYSTPLYNLLTKCEDDNYYSEPEEQNSKLLKPFITENSPITSNILNQVVKKEDFETTMYWDDTYFKASFSFNGLRELIFKELRHRGNPKYDVKYYLGSVIVQGQSTQV